MLAALKGAGANGIEIKRFIKIFADKWGFRVRTVRGYISDLVELEDAKIDKSRIYHSMFYTPGERWKRII